MEEYEGERLQKVLARAGVASRRACEELIAAGRVKINGKVVTKMGTRVNPAEDKVLVDDQPVPIKGDVVPKKMYLALNKPEGYLSTVTDPQGRPTVMDLVESGQRLFPVGRLDADTKGLLIITNDGEFANALMHPRSGVEKEYLVLLDGIIRMKKLDDLREGVNIPVEDPDTGERQMVRTRPAEVEFLRHEGSNTLIKVVLKEGKKRQVRLMGEAIGYRVLDLTRVRYGPVKLSDLPSGKTRRLTAEEVKELLDQATAGLGIISNAPPPRRASDQDRERFERDTRDRSGSPDRPQREGFGERRGGFGRDDRGGDRPAPRFQDRGERPEGSRPPFNGGEDRPRRDFAPREDRPRPSFGRDNDRGPARDFGDRPRRDFGPGRDREDRPRRDGPPAYGRSDDRPRRDGPPAFGRGEDRPRRDGPPAYGRGEDRPRRDGPPAFGRGEDRPRRDGPPAYGRGNDRPRPSFGRGDSRPPFRRDDARPPRPVEGDGEGRPERPRFQDRGERPEGSRPPINDRPRRDFEPRGDRPRPSFGRDNDRPRRDGPPAYGRDNDRPRPPRDFGDRPRRPAGDFERGGERPNDRPRRDGPPAYGRDNDRRPPRDFGDRPRRPAGDAERGDRPDRPRRDGPPAFGRGGGRPAPAFGRGPRQGDARPPRGDRPERSGPPSEGNGERPRRPGFGSNRGGPPPRGGRPVRNPRSTQHPADKPRTFWRKER